MIFFHLNLFPHYPYSTQLKTGKTYLDAAEKKFREAQFIAHKNLVSLHNAAHEGYTLALNKFADLSKAEFLNLFTGNTKSASGE